MTVIIAVRIRGTRGVRRKTSDCLKHLRLNRAHSCVMLEMSPSVKGMITQANEYIAWGEADARSVALLLEKRGDFKARKPDAAAFAAMGAKDAAELAEAIVAGKAKLAKLYDAGLNPVFRLAPARKGFGSIKHPAPAGSLGKHKEIFKLLSRMA